MDMYDDVLIDAYVVVIAGEPNMGEGRRNVFDLIVAGNRPFN